MALQENLDSVANLDHLGFRDFLDQRVVMDLAFQGRQETKVLQEPQVWMVWMEHQDYPALMAFQEFQERRASKAPAAPLETTVCPSPVRRESVDQRDKRESQAGMV